MIPIDCRRFFFAGFFWLLATITVHAQSPLNAFLGGAAQDPGLAGYTAKLNFLHQKSYRLSPIQRIQVTTRNNELQTDKYQYGLRLTPANPWEVKYNNLLFNAYETTLLLERELVFKKALAKRYQLVVELIYLNEIGQVREEIMKNILFQINTLDQQRASRFFDAEDYVKLKLSQLEELAELEELKAAADHKAREAELLNADQKLATAAWTYKMVLPLARLEQVVDSLLTGPLYTTRVAYRQQLIIQAEHAYGLEKSNINLGFVQTQYYPYRLAENKSTMGNMGFSVGVTIPLFNTNKGDMADKKLNILEAKSELNQEQQQAAAEVNLLIHTLKSSLQRYNNLEQNIRAFPLQETLSVVSGLKDNNPRVTLQVQAQLLKLQKVQLQLKKDIYLNYVKLLTATDIINQKPLVNYLSSGLPPLM
jgi:hypothetical protein